eukprot:INCI13473.11.p1 GENE.INCI13473.11~~INCI13473.11.p1  ORF type:complete len:906 (-),score=119.40 INCI13473.11:212-2929(-)
MHNTTSRFRGKRSFFYSLVVQVVFLVLWCKVSSLQAQLVSRGAINTDADHRTSTVPVRTTTEIRELTRRSTTTTTSFPARGGDEATRGATTSIVRGTAPPVPTRVTTTAALRTRNPSSTTGRRGGGGDDGNTVWTRAPLTTKRQPGITRPQDANEGTRSAGGGGAPSDSRTATGAVRDATSEAGARVYSSRDGRDRRTTLPVRLTDAPGELGSVRTASLPSNGVDQGVVTREQPQGEVRADTEAAIWRFTPLVAERITEAVTGTRYFVRMGSEAARASISETQPELGSRTTVSLNSEFAERELTMPLVTTKQPESATREGPPSLPGSRATQERRQTDPRGPAVSDRSTPAALDLTRYQADFTGLRGTITGTIFVTRAAEPTALHDRTLSTIDSSTGSTTQKQSVAITRQTHPKSATTPDARPTTNNVSPTRPVSTTDIVSPYASSGLLDSTDTVGVSAPFTSTALPPASANGQSSTAATTDDSTLWTTTESPAPDGQPSSAVQTDTSLLWTTGSPAPRTMPMDSYSHSTAATLSSQATSDRETVFDATTISFSNSISTTLMLSESTPTMSKLFMLNTTSAQAVPSPQTGANCEGGCNSGTERVANGKCNNGNNNCGCGWDGGDCCLPSVMPDQFSNCGGSVELCCLDPTGVSSTTPRVEVTDDMCIRLACVLLSFIRLHSLFTQQSPLLLHLEQSGMIVDQISVLTADLNAGSLDSVEDTVVLVLDIDDYDLQTFDVAGQAQLTAGLVSYFDDDVFQGLAVVRDDDITIVTVSVAMGVSEVSGSLLSVPSRLGRVLQENSVQVEIQISLPAMSISEFIASQIIVTSTLSQQAPTTAAPGNSTSQQGYIVELSREEIIAIASVGAAIVVLAILSLGIALCCRVRSEQKKDQECQRFDKSAPAARWR